MFKVVFTVYKRYVNEKVFGDYESAKRFFYAIGKNSKVTSVKLESVC